MDTDKCRPLFMVKWLAEVQTEERRLPRLYTRARHYFAALYRRRLAYWPQAAFSETWRDSCRQIGISAITCAAPTAHLRRRISQGCDARLVRAGTVSGSTPLSTVSTFFLRYSSFPREEIRSFQLDFASAIRHLHCAQFAVPVPVFVILSRLTPRTSHGDGLVDKASSIW